MEQIIEIRDSRKENGGRGVFALKAIKAGVIIETSPALIFSEDEGRKLIQTKLNNYVFQWGDKKEIAIALGYVSMYNHDYESNCEYEMDYENETISIKTMRKINAGDELFINYNGTYNNRKPLWFSAS